MKAKLFFLILALVAGVEFAYADSSVHFGGSGADWSKAVVHDFSVVTNNRYVDFDEEFTRGGDFDGQYVLLVNRTVPKLFKIEDLLTNNISNPIALAIPDNIVNGGRYAINAGRLTQGHIYLCNLATVANDVEGGAGPLKVYHYATPTSKPEVVLTWDGSGLENPDPELYPDPYMYNGRIGDNMSISLDESGNGYAFFFKQEADNKFFRFTVRNFTEFSDVTELSLPAIANYYGMMNPVGADRYLFTSSYIAQTWLLDKDANKLLEIEWTKTPNEHSSAHACDPRVIEFNRARYIMLMNARRFAYWPVEGVNVYDISEGNDIVSALVKLEEHLEYDEEENPTEAGPIDPIYSYDMDSEVVSTACVGLCNCAVVNGKLMIFCAAPHAGFAIIEVPKDFGYTVTAKSSNSERGMTTAECKDNGEVVISAIANYGYHFTQWSDGVMDNPRIILEAYQDTTFTAIFAPNQYSINVTCDEALGHIVGESGSFDYLSEHTYEAIPVVYGYHFDHWSDGNTQNPRTITVTEDKSYQAIFTKNIYKITKNAEHGTIFGNSSAEYLDFVTLTVTPDYGYHFTQWSDGLKDNPRIFQLTQDTTFTAEFDYDRVGKCGKDLALIWVYDPVAKVLTIKNAGEFTENMQFGVEAPNEMTELVVDNNVTAIGANAFAGIRTLTKATIGEAVKTIYEQAFYNCTGLQEIYSYRDKPSVAYSNTFDGIDKFECTLHVLFASVDMYKSATGWRDFYYIQTIDAEAVAEPIEDVSVTPSVTTAAIAWPSVENAATYELTIKDKNGNVVCTLVFNAQGQLTSIAFAAPSRSQQSTQAAGFTFTVTGLDSSSNYGFTIDAKDGNGNVIDTKSGSFETLDSLDALTDISTDKISLRKELINGQLFILRGDKTYTVQGQEVK